MAANQIVKPQNKFHVCSRRACLCWCWHADKRPNYPLRSICQIRLQLSWSNPANQKHIYKFTKCKTMSSDRSSLRCDASVPVYWMMSRPVSKQLLRIVATISMQRKKAHTTDAMNKCMQQLSHDRAYPYPVRPILHPGSFL